MILNFIESVLYIDSIDNGLPSIYLIIDLSMQWIQSSAV